MAIWTNLLSPICASALAMANKVVGGCKATANPRLGETPSAPATAHDNDAFSLHLKISSAFFGHQRG
jgi:hypothetical protein